MKKTNFIAGGRMNVLVYVITQAALFTAALVWQARECFKEAGLANKDEDVDFDKLEDKSNRKMVDKESEKKAEINNSVQSEAY